MINSRILDMTIVATNMLNRNSLDASNYMNSSNNMYGNTSIMNI